MNLANPAALFWAGLAVPIVIFYILKIRLRRVPVSTVIFWRQIFEEKKPRSLWQRLRHLLSLLVQLLFLGLLVVALAQPFFRWEIEGARRLVLVVDNSASMNATDVAPTRLTRAKELGQRLAAGSSGPGRNGDCGRGNASARRLWPDRPPGQLAEALQELPAGDGPTCVLKSLPWCGG